MHKPAMLLICLLVAASSWLHGEEWNKTFTVGDKPELTIDTSDASIELDTWQQNSIAVQVKAENYKIGQSVHIEDHQAGNAVNIQVRFPIHLFHFDLRSHRVEIVVHMARQGRINLHTGDGHIKVSNFMGEMELDSGDGHQDIESVDGSLHAHTNDGHIRAWGRFDQLDVKTGDGRVEVRALSGSRMNSDWDLQTGDGSIKLELPENLDADVDLHTGDGHISSDLPISVSGQLKGNSIRGRLNAGGKRLTIHTGDGSITLERLSL